MRVVFPIARQTYDVADDVMIWIDRDHFYEKTCLENSGRGLHFEETAGMLVEERFIDLFGRTTREWIEAGRPGRPLDSGVVSSVKREVSRMIRQIRAERSRRGLLPESGLRTAGR